MCEKPRSFLRRMMKGTSWKVKNGARAAFRSAFPLFFRFSFGYLLPVLMVTTWFFPFSSLKDWHCEALLTSRVPCTLLRYTFFSELHVPTQPFAKISNYIIQCVRSRLSPPRPSPSLLVPIFFRSLPIRINVATLWWLQHGILHSAPPLTAPSLLTKAMRCGAIPIRRTSAVNVCGIMKHTTAWDLSPFSFARNGLGEPPECFSAFFLISELLAQFPWLQAFYRSNFWREGAGRLSRIYSVLVSAPRRVFVLLNLRLPNGFALLLSILLQSQLMLAPFPHFSEREDVTSHHKR